MKKKEEHKKEHKKEEHKHEMSCKSAKSAKEPKGNEWHRNTTKRNRCHIQIIAINTYLL